MTDNNSIRIGASVFPHLATIHALRDLWRTVDSSGADYLFTWDHFFPLPIYANGLGTHFECYTQLASMAEVTSHVRFGALVTAIGYRNPNLLADMARTIDHLSGGRFVLGLGAGTAEKDFVEYGYEFKSGPERLRDLRDALPVVMERLTTLNPPPIQDHIPILIGGSGAKVTLRIVAEHADIWNGFGPPDVVAANSRILDEWCARIGRDPATIERSVLAGADTIVRDAEAYVAAGITTLIVRVPEPGIPIEALNELVAWRDSK